MPAEWEGVSTETRNAAAEAVRRALEEIRTARKEGREPMAPYAIRLTAKERADLKAASAALGLSPSELARDLIRQGLHRLQEPPAGVEDLFSLGEIRRAFESAENQLADLARTRKIGMALGRAKAPQKAPGKAQHRTRKRG